jgi:hypothetical protein
MSNVRTRSTSNAQQNRQRRNCSDREFQSYLEQLFAARRAAQDKRNARFAVDPGSARRDVRSNIIEWREEAREQQLRTLPLPLPPGEDGAEPVVGPTAERVILLLVAIAAVVVIVARVGGVL